MIGSMLIDLLEYFLVSPFKEPWCQEALMTPPRGGMGHTHDQGVSKETLSAKVNIATICYTLAQTISAHLN